MGNDINFKSGYSKVNGLKMYYEIHGQGKPFVLIHGGGPTIETSFGNLIPLLSKDRQIIAMDLQAHGHMGDRETDLTDEKEGKNQLLVTFELIPLFERVQLKVTHKDLSGEAWQVVSLGWSAILPSLKSLLETGVPISSTTRRWKG